MVEDLLSEAPTRSPREVLALIRWLPADSAYRASVAGGIEHRGWSAQTWILKHIFDATQVQTVVNMKIAAGKKGRSIKAPEPLPGPEVAKRTRGIQLKRLPRGIAGA